MTSLELTQPTVLDSMQVLRDFADAVITSVPEQPDERLIEIGRDANALAKASFRIRGAVAVEIKSRVVARHKGPGRPEIGKAMSQAARAMDIAPSTLQDDCKIFETFSDYLRGDTDLDREHFRHAMAAPDPQAAIELALEQKIANSSYSTRDFREDVKRLQGGEQADEVSKGRWIHAKLDEDGADALDYLQQHLSKPPAEIVNQILVERADYSREKK